MASSEAGAGGAALAAAGALATGAAVGVDSGVAAGGAVVDTEQLQHFAACSGFLHPVRHNRPSCYRMKMAGTKPLMMKLTVHTGPCRQWLLQRRLQSELPHAW